MYKLHLVCIIFSGKTVDSVFIVKLHKTVYLADDPQKQCADYPTAEFQTYNQCDENFVKNTLPAGLVPFWTTNNMNMATKYKGGCEYHKCNFLTRLFLC